jgi:hypothetical protein
MLLGWVLMLPDTSFNGNPSFTWMAQLMNEDSWAIVLFVIGTSRLIGLLVNGSMESVTPWIRVVGAICGFAVFSVIATSMLVSFFLLDAPPSTGLAIYIPAACTEIAAIYLAVIDARIYRDAKRSGFA